MTNKKIYVIIIITKEREDKLMKVKRVFYVKNEDVAEIMKKLQGCRCTASVETVEMNYSELTISCPSIIATIDVENVLASYV